MSPISLFAQQLTDQFNQSGKKEFFSHRQKKQMNINGLY